MNTFDDSVLSLLVVLPFAAAVALILWPGDEIRPMKWFSAVVALTSTALVLVIMLRFDYTDGPQ